MPAIQSNKLHLLSSLRLGNIKQVTHRPKFIDSRYYVRHKQVYVVIGKQK